MSAFGGGFGQQSSAFGNSNSAPFGAQNTFGAQSSSLFGTGQSQSFGAFGQSAAGFGANSSVFGASSNPAFGNNQSTSAFGSAFGSAFASQPAPFGSSSAFGSSQSSFGSTAFGNSRSSLFGASSAPAFGASSSAFGQPQQAWGQSSSAFGGSGAFGSSSAGVFGNPAGGSNFFGAQSSAAFGGSAQQQVGTRGANWQLTVEYEGGPGVQSKYQAINMMQQFRGKSLEELRLEDYSAGNKDGSSQQQPGGTGSLFGGSSQPPMAGGLFGSNSAGGAFGSNANSAFGSNAMGFGNTSAFGAPNTGGGFGSSTTTAGLFGNSSTFSGPGLGQSSSNAFGGGVQGGGGAFGAQSGGSLFGQQSAPAFGMQSQGGFANPGGGFAGSAAGFGGNGNVQAGGSSLFGQAGGTGFGAASTQAPLFGGNVQSGAGLFGASGGGSLFGSQPQSAPNVFGGGAAAPGSLFGAAAGTGSAPSLFGNQNAAGQKPLFGAGQASGPAGNAQAGFGSTVGNTGLFGNAGSGIGGQSAPSNSFGFSGFGAQPNQPQSAPTSLFGGSGGQVGGVAPGLGVNPTLQSTMTAVTQDHGGTVLPPGANYGTVLFNLQKLQSEIGAHKKLLEQQAIHNASNTKPPDTLSVVVVPSPSVVKLSSNRVSAPSGPYRGGRIPHRTQMRSTVASIGGSGSKISGTPIRSLGLIRGQDAVPSTPGNGADIVRRMPFFSPNHFSGPRRKPIRASELGTPIRSTPRMLPIPGKADTLIAEKPDDVWEESVLANGSKGRVADEQDQYGQGIFANGGSVPTRRNGSGRHTSIDVNDTSIDKARMQEGEKSTRKVGSEVEVQRRLELQHSTGKKGMKQAEVTSRQGGARPSAVSLLWSQQNPSSWSLNRGADSPDQYNPEKYLPYQTKDEYYTVPSISELSARTMTELQRVENFTVGRKGYGEISWVEPVDVRGLDLDVVVDIQRGEFAVYPEREAHQLDAHARVKLEGMFKKDKTGNPTSDADKIERYGRKLKQFCESNNMQFEKYDALKGIWELEVWRFTDD